jgi:hypothetical protein
MSDSLDKILSDDYLGDVTTLLMDHVRARRAQCKDVETGLSYLRRMVQGRLDIVTAEQARRAEGGAPGDITGLIERLPSVLAENTRAPGSGRLTMSFDTGAVDEDLVAELNGIASTTDLSDSVEISDEALQTMHGCLHEFELKVSGLRRSLFARIDSLESEITRRYRSGEASVDTLLP